MAHGQRLIPQTVTVVQQQHLRVAEDIGGGWPSLVHQRVRRTGGEDERIPHHDLVIEFADIGFDREERGIEPRRRQPADQIGRSRFRPKYGEVGISARQGRHDFRQQIRRDGRNHPKTQRAVERIGAAPCDVKQVVNGEQDRACLSDDGLGGRGDTDPAVVTLEEREAEVALGLRHLCAERWLRDMTRGRSAPEAPEIGDRDQVLELAKRDTWGGSGIHSPNLSLLDKRYLGQAAWARSEFADGRHPDRSREVTDPAIRISADTLAQLAADAARAGDLQTLALLLSAGVAVGTTTPRGESLLMLAAYHDRLDAVRLLLKSGADPDQRDARGQTPLTGVAFKGLIDIAAALVEGGADVNAPTTDGRTPLSLAAAFNRADMVRWLLDHGASRDMRDAAGKRAVDVASALGAADSVRILGGQ